VVSSVAAFILFLLLLIVTLPLVALSPITLLILVKLARKPKRRRPPHSFHILGVFRERNATASFAAVSASVDGVIASVFA
jgi:hypothetical protein